MSNFDILDAGDDVDEEARQVAARRMFMYSPQALLAADEVDRKYVIFPELKGVLTAFDRAYQLALRVRQPQGVLITGAPGTSKTTVSEYFRFSLPQSKDIFHGYGALSIRLRSNPCAGAIVSLLLRALSNPFSDVTKKNFGTKRDVAFEGLREHGTRLIFIDQAHVLEQGVRKSSRPLPKSAIETTASEVLRDLMDETGIALAFLASDNFGGLERIDEALADRVSVRLSLRHFEDNKVWRQFLAEIGKRTKCIDLTILCDEPFAGITHKAVSGNRRRTMLLLTEAVLVAIDAGAPLVDRSHFETALLRISGASSQVVNPYAAA